jgi:hypothetical protein
LREERWRREDQYRKGFKWEIKTYCKVISTPEASCTSTLDLLVDAVVGLAVVGGPATVGGREGGADILEFGSPDAPERVYVWKD